MTNPIPKSTEPVRIVPSQAEVSLSPAGAQVTIYRSQRWSRVAIDRWENLPDATSEQQAAFQEVARKWIGECRQVGIRTGCGFGSGRTFQDLHVPRGREDEALADLFAVEAMQPVR